MIRAFIGELVTRFLQREPVAALLAGSVGDFSGQRIDLEIDEDFRFGIEGHQLVIPAGAKLFIEGDGDGSLFGGSFTFDSDADAFLIIGVSAVVTTRASQALPLTPAAGRLAFEAGSEIVFTNGFIHPRKEPLRDALLRDLPLMVAPGELAERPLQTAPSGEPSQFVHLGGSGSVVLSGSLRWSAILLETGVISAEALALERTALVETRAGAMFQWRGSLEGTFDLLLFASGEGKLEARLSRSRLSRRRRSFEAGAEIVLAGVESAVDAILDPVFEPAGRIVRALDRHLAGAADLRKLLASEAEEEIDRLLGSAEFVESARRVLEEIGIDVDLRKRVRMLIADAVGIAAARTIDRIEERTGPAVDALRELVREYRSAIRRMDREVRDAARVEVGLSLSSATSVQREEEAILIARFDPARSPDLLIALLHGDWSAALDRADDHPGVEVEGSWRRKGSLKSESQLELRVFRARAGVGSMLRQGWESEVGAFGDLTITTRGAMEVWTKRWRSLHTIRVLLDSRITAAVAGVPDRERRRITVEWSFEGKPTVAALQEWRDRLVRAGILAAGTSMIDDLPLPGETHRQRPFGEVLLTARFAAQPEDVDSFASQPTGKVQAIFARILAREYADTPLLRQSDATGLPLFAWPSVLRSVRSGELDRKAPLRVRSSKGDEVLIRGDEAPFVAFASRLVLLFGGLQGDLRALRRKGEVADDADVLAEEIARTELRMLRRIRSVTSGSLLRRDDLGFAFFRALFELWTKQQRDARVVVLRKADKRRFVYP